MIRRAVMFLLPWLGACAGPPFPPQAGEHNDQVIAVAGADGGAALADLPPVAEKDPAGGKFTLEEATAQLPPGGKLGARIVTSLGVLTCELHDDRAPVTVANFVGLARGLRPFKTESGKWVKRPAYDGTTFHRVIKGFMIQGGDPKGNGMGEPGYVIPDEI
jgi:peptidyl-prolyl cis-trans isomerase A (cyclophilin A)